MNNKIHRRLHLAARNEGKIKSFESCVDVRAWSHDIQIRDYYLRDWIKCDMPICVVPVCALASILTIMTCRNRRKVDSRCHMNCKSKILVDSISSSCNAMKKCLSNNKEFEKYFVEEELETIHWPCDRCLEVLKSIKMFWKIVIEKALKIPRTEICTTDNEIKYVNSGIKNIAKEWRNEIVQEAKYIKSYTLLFKNKSLVKNRSTSIENESKMFIKDTRTLYNYENKLIETECGVRSVASQKDDKSLSWKINKSTSANIKMKDGETYANGENKNEEITFDKNYIDDLKHQYILQQHELDQLEIENMSLNFELQCIRQNCLNNNVLALSPASFEIDSEDNNDKNPAKIINSDVVISLKNCTNKNFSQVSMLQVLYKTNEKKNNLNECSCIKKEDPMHILKKVHKTFGEIVNREISIANNPEFSKNQDVIKSTFRNFDASNTSLYSTSSYSMSFETHFESARETSKKSDT